MICGLKFVAGAVVTSFLVCSCSGGHGGGDSGLHEFRSAAPSIEVAADSDSVDNDIVVPPMTSQGVGPVRLGIDTSLIPARLAGVYDTVVVDTEVVDDLTFLSLDFVRGDSTVMVGDADYGGDGMPSRLMSLAVVGRGPSVNVEGVRIGVGTRRSALSSLRGLRHGSDDRGEFAEWHGVTLYLDSDTVAAMSVGECQKW